MMIFLAIFSITAIMMIGIYLAISDKCLWDDDTQSIHENLTKEEDYSLYTDEELKDLKNKTAKYLQCNDYVTAMDYSMAEALYNHLDVELMKRKLVKELPKR